MKSVFWAFFKNLLSLHGALYIICNNYSPKALATISFIVKVYITRQSIVLIIFTGYIYTCT